MRGYIFILILIIASCSSHDEKKIVAFPKEYHGEWVDEYGEFKMIISDSTLKTVESGYTDTLNRLIHAIYLIDRNKCEDCSGYGVRVEFSDDLQLQYYLYLEVFHPDIKKFLVLRVGESVVNPYTERREYYDSKVWKRSNLVIEK